MSQISKRKNFKSPWIFVLAAIGSAAGLGNLWRFPYLAYEHGGAAFFIAYFICLFAIGLPFLIMEVGLGQITRKGAPLALGAIGHKKRFRIIGWFAVFISFLILTYYLVITGWTINYAFNGINLPWHPNSESYFYKDFLHISSGITNINHFNYPIMIGVIITLILVYLFMYKGTSGISIVAKWITPIPFILLIILCINSVSLSGAMIGLRVFFIPKWSSLYSWDLWFDAASQVLFSLSLGFGVMFAYGAILGEKVNVKHVATWIVSGDTFVAILGGIIVFSVLGHMAAINHVPISEVVKQGIGLAFVVIPKALALLPYGNKFFSLIFYISLFLLAFTSIVSLFESVLAAMMDGSQRIRRGALLLVNCIVIFLIGLLYTANNGLYILDIVDHYISGYGIVIVCILETIAIGWFYDAERLRYNLQKQSKVKLGIFFNIFIRFLIPAVLIILCFRQTQGDLEHVYGGYPVFFNVIYGLGSLAILVILSIFCNRKFR